MEAITEVQAYKGLASAILLSAYTNIIKHRYLDEKFIKSQWCDDLCEMAGIVYPLYIRKAYELSDENKASTKPPKGLVS